MTANETVFELEYRDPCCIIAGSEDKGVFSGLLKIMTASSKFHGREIRGH